MTKQQARRLLLTPVSDLTEAERATLPPLVTREDIDAALRDAPTPSLAKQHSRARKPY